MKAAGRRKLLWALVLAVFMTGIPTGIVYATSTQEKLNQAQKDKKETQSQLSETEDNLPAVLPEHFFLLLSFSDYLRFHSTETEFLFYLSVPDLIFPE